MADIDRLLFLWLAAADQKLLRPNHAAVLAGQANGLAAMSIDQVYDFLVDESAEDHLDDIHGLAIRYPHALDELGFLAYALEQLIDLRATTMDHNGIDADEFQQHDVAREAALEVVVDHRIAAVLDDHGLAVKALNIRQRLGQHLREIARLSFRDTHWPSRSGRDTLSGGLNKQRENIARFRQPHNKKGRPCGAACYSGEAFFS